MSWEDKIWENEWEEEDQKTREKIFNVYEFR